MINNFYKSLPNKLFSVTKPGIIFGNVVTVIGGYFLAVGHNASHLGLLLMVLLGISLIMASGCVFNNYIDRDIDKIMQRTKNRVLARGLLSNAIAVNYAIGLGLFGIIILYIFTNLLSVTLALIGLFVYVVMYSLWLKRTSIYATIIGSVSGAIPPIVGYCSVTNSFDSGAVILFLMLSIWQMPHSYAIAIYRFNDYKNASIPILPVKLGIQVAKIHMLAYVILFACVSVMLSVFSYTGYVYLTVSCLLTVSWICLAIYGFKVKNSNKWARQMFGLSILIIVLLSVFMAIDTI